MIPKNTVVSISKFAPIKIPFSIRLHQSSPRSRERLWGLVIKCNVRSNIGIHLPPFPSHFQKKIISKKNHRYFDFKIASMKIPFSKLCPRFRSVQKSQESRMLQYRYTSFPLLTLPRDFPRETIVSISNRCSIKIPFPFRSTLSTGVENGKIVDDHHWTNGYSYKLQNAWILNAERGFDSISRGPDPEQLGEREEVDSGARSLVACCDAACYIGWNLLTLRQRPRLVDAVHVSSNVTPCRAATRSCIERVPLVLAALWGGDPPRVSDRIHTNLCGFSTPVTVGFFLSLYVSTCTRRFSSPTLIILHVIVRDSTLPHKRWNESLALDRWRIFWSFVARVEVVELRKRDVWWIVFFRNWSSYFAVFRFVSLRGNILRIYYIIRFKRGDLYKSNS